jgi:hypothetical protein
MDPDTQLTPGPRVVPVILKWQGPKHVYQCQLYGCISEGV